LRNGLRTPCCFATIDPLSLAVPSPVTMLVRYAYSCRWSRHRSAGPLLARFPAPAAPESAIGAARTNKNRRSALSIHPGHRENVHSIRGDRCG
jgi:hypothetical protein